MSEYLPPRDAKGHYIKGFTGNPSGPAVNKSSIRDELKTLAGMEGKKLGKFKGKKFCQLWAEEISKMALQNENPTNKRWALKLIIDQVDGNLPTMNTSVNITELMEQVRAAFAHQDGDSLPLPILEDAKQLTNDNPLEKRSLDSDSEGV